MKKMIFLLALMASFFTKGQNLVQNGSFEDTNCDICSTLYEFYEGCVDQWQNYTYAPSAFDSSIPNCTFYNGAYYYAPDQDKHALVGSNRGIFQEGNFPPGTYTISFLYTRGEAIYQSFPVYINAGFANGLVNVDWSDNSNLSIPIENVVSQLVLEDDPINWATYTGTFQLTEAYEDFVIYGSSEEQFQGNTNNRAPDRRVLIDNVVLECQNCCTPEPVTITANGEDITTSLTYEIPCGETCVTLAASNITNAVYNTSDPVLADLEGLFCLPPNSTLTSFTATITGTDTCGDPYSQNVIITVEQECCPYIEMGFALDNSYQNPSGPRSRELQ
ncbi:MAG: hypothetical protein R2793_09880 [Flavobacteriaceae bacterium]